MIGVGHSVYRTSIVPQVVLSDCATKEVCRTPSSEPFLFFYVPIMGAYFFVNVVLLTAVRLVGYGAKVPFLILCSSNPRQPDCLSLGQCVEVCSLLHDQG